MSASTVASAITELAFVSGRRRAWDELDSLARKTHLRGLKSLTVAEVARVSPLYRDVCADLAQAMAARYSAPLVDSLQGIVASGHTVLYGPYAARERRTERRGIVAAISAFPRTVRKYKWPMLIAAALFFVPTIGALIATLIHPDYALLFVPAEGLDEMTEAYQQGFDHARATGINGFMAGFYVQHNVGIALTCFASGIFAGVGSAYILIENGFGIGAIMGYVAAHGAGDNILTFVVGHSSLELGACVISGGAGIAMGWAFVSPGEKTRLASLQAVAKELVVVVFGISAMLCCAAMIEGFWSASSMPSIVKRIVGGVMFVVVMSFLLFAGRDEKGLRKEAP